MPYLARRLVRLVAVAVILPLGGTLVVNAAERMERASGPSTKSRALRQAGSLLSQRRR
ncbi:MAG: hypothetical protein M3063_11480 [Actinomycetota bacterium]|nr:hypothetical protein [Actinomycetota bacterium]